MTREEAALRKNQLKDLANISQWSSITMTWSQHEAKILAYLELITSYAASRGGQATLDDMYTKMERGMECEMDEDKETDSADTSDYTSCEPEAE